MFPGIRLMPRKLHAGLAGKKLAELHGIRSKVFSRKFKPGHGDFAETFSGRATGPKVVEKIVSTELSIREIAGKYRFCSEFR